MADARHVKSVEPDQFGMRSQATPRCRSSVFPFSHIRALNRKQHHGALNNPPAGSIAMTRDHHK
jgi:hypothetical protein